MKTKLILLASLYISQYIPTTFFIQTVPVLMRQQNMSLGAIGFLGFLIVPSALKFLWSPLVDRYRLPGLGHYRGWIIGFQSLSIVTLLVTAFLDVQTNITGLLVCMFLAFLFSSSQDIATDALAVNLLLPQERGIGNAIQASGNFLGAIIGGGAALILLEKAGFRTTLLTMAIALLLCLVPILFHQEHLISVAKSTTLKSYLQPFIRFFSRPKMGLWLLVVLLYMISENVSGTLIRPLLVDRGLSLSDIGWLLGVVSYVSRIIAALMAGVLIGQWGRKRSLITFGVIANVAALLYILPAAGVASPSILYAVCILVSGLQSMAYTALLTAMMDRSNPTTAGTDYTTQISVAFVGVVATTVLGGMVADAIGYTLTLIIGAVVSLSSMLLIPKVYKDSH
ncbi:MFS transporter [Floridanema evergladense]|uniref:MFS transporter n=1 Tax=Floridaenema evergladense BLCC-F167 TaxID=3153639 RepID=A0ABV4WDH2_9CYAN